MEIPVGSVTFLFTDIEGSTKLWEKDSSAMGKALSRHDSLLLEEAEKAGGYVFKRVGDSFCVAFIDAPHALSMAISSQQALLKEPWQEDIPIKVRMAIHSGAVESRDGDYFGQPLNRVARLLSAGHGGQILVSEVAQCLCLDQLPSQVILDHLGEFRLKDLGRPESIFQVHAEGLPQSFPTLNTLSNYLHNLPVQTSSFVGRTHELKRLEGLFAQTRLLTLTGSGGCGKSRLSLHFASDHLESFPDGVWLTELAPITDPALVPQTIATAMGIREDPKRSFTEQLLSALRERTILLVIDNCEHLLTSCSEIIDLILRSCPRVKIIASSRENLGLTGETTYRVPSLTLPKLEEDEETDISSFESVALFVERAKQANPEFSLTWASTGSVVSICRRLDGIPLALELAAARVRSMSLEDISKRLDDRFRLLTGGSRTSLPRQQTLRALVDWSYFLLNNNEKLLFARLSVFNGGWTLNAAEEVCSDLTLDELDICNIHTSLVDKCLVTVIETEDGIRYGYLETVRQYAREKLQEDKESDLVRGRHADYFSRFSVQAHQGFRGPELGLWIRKWKEDFDNIRFAAEYYLSNKKIDDSLGFIARSWDTYCQFAGGFEELSSMLKLAQERLLTVNEEGRLNPLIRLYLAKAIEQGGLLHLAIELYNNLLAEFEGQEATTDYVALLVSLSRCLLLNGNIDDSVLLAEKAVEVAKVCDDPFAIVSALNSLGGNVSFQRRFEEARHAYTLALVHARTLNSAFGMETSLSNLGGILRLLGIYDEAEACITEAITIIHRNGMEARLPRTLCSSSRIKLLKRDYQNAEELGREALSISSRLLLQEETRSSLIGLGQALYCQGKFEEAVDILTKSLAGFTYLFEETTSLSVLLACLVQMKDLRKIGEILPRILSHLCIADNPNIFEILESVGEFYGLVEDHQTEALVLGYLLSLCKTTEGASATRDSVIPKLRQLSESDPDLEYSRSVGEKSSYDEIIALIFETVEKLREIYEWTFEMPPLPEKVIAE